MEQPLLDRAIVAKRGHSSSMANTSIFERSQKSSYLPYFTVSKIFFHTSTTLKLGCVSSDWYLRVNEIKDVEVSILKSQNIVWVKKNPVLPRVICFLLSYFILQWFSILFLLTKKMDT